MRRFTHPLGRAVRATYLLWLTFMLTQPVPVHACPLTTSAELAANAQSVLASGGALCAPSEPGHPATPAHHGTSPCHCVGDCCHSMAALPALPPTAVPVPVRIALRQLQYPVVEHSFRQPEYRLPPSTAPPTLA